MLFLSLYFHWPVRPTTPELIYLSWWSDTDRSPGPTVSKVVQQLSYKHRLDTWTQSVTGYQQQEVPDHLSLFNLIDPQDLSGSDVNKPVWSHRGKVNMQLSYAANMHEELCVLDVVDMVDEDEDETSNKKHLNIKHAGEGRFPMIYNVLFSLFTCYIISYVSIRGSHPAVEDWFRHSGATRLFQFRGSSRQMCPSTPEQHKLPPPVGSFLAQHIPWFIALLWQTVFQRGYGVKKQSENVKRTIL